MLHADAPSVVELHRGRTDDRNLRSRAHSRELKLQPARHRDIVGVEPSDIRAASHIEAAIERGGEAELLVVSEHVQTRVVHRLENLGRPVGGCVVHDDELELRNRLAEDARNRGSDVRLAVVDGEEHGDERHGRHGRRSLRPVSRELPSFDLVVATTGRSDELATFLDSVEAQDFERLRVIVVDQNDDERVESIVRGRSVDVAHVRSERGLSRARNVALELVDADLVAFPDDDCIYPEGLLTRVAGRFHSDRELDGLAGRAADAEGRSSASWKTDSVTLTDDNLWNRANAATIFLRRDLVTQIGDFDEHLGLGSGEPWSSGEETDYLIRAVRAGARIEYEPDLVVLHDVVPDDALVGRRDGASVGYLLRKHRYPPRVLARMLVRPAGGIAHALVHGDLPRARYYLASVRGRIRGYTGASRLKSSA